MDSNHLCLIIGGGSAGFTPPTPPSQGGESSGDLQYVMQGSPPLPPLHNMGKVPGTCSTLCRDHPPYPPFTRGGKFRGLAVRYAGITPPSQRGERNRGPSGGSAMITRGRKPWCNGEFSPRSCSPRPETLQRPGGRFPFTEKVPSVHVNTRKSINHAGRPPDLDSVDFGHRPEPEV
jgi:hypothetical protein